MMSYREFLLDLKANICFYPEPLRRWILIAFKKGVTKLILN